MLKLKPRLKSTTDRHLDWQDSDNIFHAFNTLGIKEKDDSTARYIKKAEMIEGILRSLISVGINKIYKIQYWNRCHSINIYIYTYSENEFIPAVLKEWKLIYNSKLRLFQSSEETLDVWCKINIE